MTLGISKALAAAVADGTVADFLAELRTCGGRVVAEMLEGAVEAVVEKKGGGDENDALSAAATAASAAAAASHERLHSGPWYAVPPAWRDAYTLACLVQAEEEKTEGGKKKDESRMRLIDMALLLGGRRFRALAHSAAASLSVALSSSYSSLPPLPEAWPLPETPVELPSGSMGESDRGRRVEALLLQGQAPPPPPLPPPPPSLEDFVSRATARPNPLPFVLPSCVSSWPALQRWTSPRYWDRVAGNRTVPVEVGSSYLEEGWSQELRTLRSFLDGHVFFSCPASSASASKTGKDKDRRTGYLAQHDLLEQVPELCRDVLTPDYALALSSGGGGRKGSGDGEEEEGEEGRGGEPDVARNFWLGPAGTLSPLHTDPKRNLFCQVFGRKYVRLYCPRESSEVLLLERERGRENEKEQGSGGGGGITEALTAANTSSADLFFPSESVASLHFFDTILTPGDALYIPEGWWHFVLSLEPSASVSFWF